jgi:hypothetical protein
MAASATEPVIDNMKDGTASGLPGELQKRYFSYADFACPDDGLSAVGLQKGKRPVLAAFTGFRDELTMVAWQRSN